MSADADRGTSSGRAEEQPAVAAMRANGEWNPLWDSLAELDPEWTEAYMAVTMRTYRGDVLTPEVVELLCIAVDAACTHLYAPGVRRHIRAALDLGVSGREILAVLQLATTVGIHTCNVGVPILAEELARSGGDDPSGVGPTNVPARGPVHGRDVAPRGPVRRPDPPAGGSRVGP